MTQLVGAFAILTHDSLDSAPVRHGFTTHKGTAGGALAQSGDFSSLARTAGFAQERTLSQVHGAVVVRADTVQSGAAADAVITRETGLLLGIQTADCVPILYFDPRHQAVGAAHAGWRGTAAKIAEATLAAMREAFGTRPADVLVVIGPAIGPCCFEVGPEVLEALEAATPGAGQPAGRTLRDRDTANLWRANRMQLERAGVPAAHIGMVNVCTCCRADLFPSFRRDGQAAGRLYSFIGLRASGLLLS